MTASAHILQMVRAHYRRDESAFASAAGALARMSNVPGVRAEIVDCIRRSGQSGGAPARQMDQPRQLQPAPAIGMLQPLPDIGLADLLLPAELQANLDELMIELEYRDELAGRGLRARNRLLFHGPPGNGKTSVAAGLANALGVQAYCVSIPAVVGMHLGETGANLGKIFASIRNDMVVVFDELDAIGSTRGGVGHSADKEMNATLNCLLMLFDRNKHGIIVATTNRPDIVDPALLRRFDERILFPEPSDEQKTSLAWKLCERFKVPPVPVLDCENLDEVTKKVEREARRAVMKELITADSDSETAETKGESPLN